MLNTVYLLILNDIKPTYFEHLRHIFEEAEEQENIHTLEALY